jgi:hypothetical protein
MAVPRTWDPSIVVPSDQARPDGSFDVAGVAPGSYFLVASARDRIGIVPLQVGDANIDNVVIATTIGFQVTGRVVIEGQPRNGGAANVTNLRIFLQRVPDLLGMPDSGPTFSPPPTADGSFLLQGVPPGDYRVTFGPPGMTQLFSLPEDMYIKSIRFGNTDVLEGGLHVTGPSRNQLEIVLGANAGRISGTVSSTRGGPLAGITIVAVPDVGDRARSDRYKPAATDESGRFRIQGLAPGSYTLFAFDDIEDGAWQDPDVLRSYGSRGTAVRVADGNDENVVVTVITAP